MVFQHSALVRGMSTFLRLLCAEVQIEYVSLNIMICFKDAGRGS